MRIETTIFFQGFWLLVYHTPSRCYQYSITSPELKTYIHPQSFYTCSKAIQQAKERIIMVLERC